MYKAIVARVKGIEIQGANTIKKGIVYSKAGTPIAIVVIGKDIVDGTLGVYFPCDGQLSQEMCDVNNLVRNIDPVTGENKGGYFSENRRVVAQKFMNVKSEGFWTPLETVQWTGIDLAELTEGMTFDVLNGKQVCSRYETAATRAIMWSPKSVQPANSYFAKHTDTAQLRYEIDSIVPGSIITITEKLHGTSGRYGLVLQEKPLTRLEKAVNWFTNKFFKIDLFSLFVYDYLIGTRNTVLAENSTGFYGNEDFRRLAVQQIELVPGEIIYFELVGYTTTGASIMPSHDVTKLRDKAISKKYGNTMRYIYGCNRGETQLFVYRITRVSEDGTTTELSAMQVMQRCKELNVSYVPLLETFIYSTPEDLIARVECLLEHESTLDPTHIREGVVIRAESSNGTKFLKEKSYTFKVLEGIAKEQDDVADMEESN